MRCLSILGLAFVHIFQLRRRQWCIQNSSSDFPSFHLYIPRPFQRSFYPAGTLVVCFTFHINSLAWAAATQVGKLKVR